MNKRECMAAGVDPAKVEKLEKMLNRAGRIAREMGVTIFGGAGSGTIRKRADSDGRDNGPLILANLDGARLWDGGDGGERYDEYGLRRGE